MADLPLFQKGDIYFVMHHDSWFSKLIAWFISSQWSHSGFIVDTSSTDRNYVSETSDYEITIGWLERYIADPNVSMEIYRLPDLSESEATEVVTRGLSQEEKLYPYWQFISLAIRGLLKKIGIHIGNFIQWGYDCNEHILYAFDNTHYPELNGVNPQSMDTEDMYVLIRGISGVTMVYSKQVDS